MFLPQAADLNDGRVITFFNPLIERLRQEGDDLTPDYPESTSTAEGKAQRDAHWKWYADRCHVDKAVKVIEEVIGTLPLTLCATGAPPVTVGSRVHQGTGLASRRAWP
jgi:hypothetical protein